MLNLSHLIRIVIWQIFEVEAYLFVVDLFLFFFLFLWWDNSFIFFLRLIYYNVWWTLKNCCFLFQRGGRTWIKAHKSCIFIDILIDLNLKYKYRETNAVNLSKHESLCVCVHIWVCDFHFFLTLRSFFCLRTLEKCRFNWN